MEVFIKILFQITLFFSFINLITTSYEGAENTTEPIQDKCELTQPMKDIKDICYDENINDRERCCYVEVKFKYNTYIRCILVDIENENIRNVIADLKDEYKVDSKSIKIDCNNTFIKLSLIFGIFIFFI